MEKENKAAIRERWEDLTKDRMKWRKTVISYTGEGPCSEKKMWKYI